MRQHNYLGMEICTDTVEIIKQKTRYYLFLIKQYAVHPKQATAITTTGVITARMPRLLPLPAEIAGSRGGGRMFVVVCAANLR